MTPKLKKIIFTILALILMFILYVLIIKEDPSVDPLITGSGSVGVNNQVLGTQISQALLRIEQIKLDKSIFTDQIYRSLQDRSIPIEPEAVGRNNPFAPIESTGAVSIERRGEGVIFEPIATSTQELTPETN